MSPRGEGRAGIKTLPPKKTLGGLGAKGTRQRVNARRSKRRRRPALESRLT